MPTRPRPGRVPLIPWTGSGFSSPVLTETGLGNGWGWGQRQGALKEQGPSRAVQQGTVGNWAEGRVFLGPGGPVTNTRFLAPQIGNHIYCKYLDKITMQGMLEPKFVNPINSTMVYLTCSILRHSLHVLQLEVYNKPRTFNPEVVSGGSLRIPACFLINKSPNPAKCKIFVSGRRIYGWDLPGQYRRCLY